MLFKSSRLHRDEMDPSRLLEELGSSREVECHLDTPSFKCTQDWACVDNMLTALIRILQDLIPTLPIIDFSTIALPTFCCPSERQRVWWREREGGEGWKEGGEVWDRRRVGKLKILSSSSLSLSIYLNQWQENDRLCSKTVKSFQNIRYTKNESVVHRTYL